MIFLLSLLFTALLGVYFFRKFILIITFFNLILPFYLKLFKMNTKKIILFASGNGSNVENIIKHFENNHHVEVAGVLTNKSTAFVIERAKKYNIPTFIFSKEDLNGKHVEQILNQLQPDLIVLAGFLLKFPEHLVKLYPNKIVNVHPALLPKYGGKGMYGMFVHQAVLDNKEVETGITIHYVNEHYDEGAIIFQASTDVSLCQSAEEIAKKVHELEYEYFPKVIATLI